MQCFHKKPQTCSFYMIAFKMRNIKTLYLYQYYKECNIHILIVPLICILSKLKDQFSKKEKWSRCTQLILKWLSEWSFSFPSCFPEILFVTRDEINISVVVRTTQPSITGWGWSGSAGSDPIGLRCCCCGGELSHKAVGLVSVGYDGM